MNSRLLLLALLALILASTVTASTVSSDSYDNDEDAVEQEEQPYSNDENEDEADSSDDVDDAVIADAQDSAQASRRRNRDMQKVLVSMYGVPQSPLEDFANEVSDIKNKLRVAYTSMKQARVALIRKLRILRAKKGTLKSQIRDLAGRIKRLKRKALQDAKRRERRLRAQLRARIRAHRAGLKFVRKLKEQVDGLRESYDENFGKNAAAVQSLIEEYVSDLQLWTGYDASVDLQKNRKIGTRTRKHRLYTKKHLSQIVQKMFSKLRAAYLASKEALRRARAGVPNPHVDRLEMMLNGLKAKLSKLDISAAKAATQLAKLESGRPSLSLVRSDYAQIKKIEDQIYTMKRIHLPKERAAAAGGCVKRVARVHRHYNRCRRNLRRAVARSAPRAQTYVLWKQYVVAKSNLRRHVHRCAQEAQAEAEEEEAQTTQEDQESSN